VEPDVPVAPGSLILDDLITPEGIAKKNIRITVYVDPDQPTPETQYASVLIMAGTLMTVPDRDNPAEVTVATQIALKAIPRSEFEAVFGQDGACELPDDLMILGEAWYFGTPGTRFDRNVEVTLSYDELDIPDGYAEQTISMITCDGSGWEVIPDQRLNTDTNTAFTEVNHFSYFALVIRKAQAEFVVERLSVSPSAAKPGEIINVEITVANTGAQDADYELILSINGEVAETVTVPVAAGKQRDVIISTIQYTEGVYSVRVGEKQNSFTIVAGPDNLPGLQLMSPGGFNYLIPLSILAVLVAAALATYFMRRRRSLRP
jgi:hypothetical protein